MIILHTNQGDITIQLDVENTPETANNFLKHASEGFYENTIFHRVIDGFMIQGGGFGSDMKEKHKQPTIQNEASKGKKNKRGTIAMARTPDPHSASTQFFINVKDNNFLNFKDESVNGFGYCVFGEVTDGMDVVDKIKGVKTTSKAGHQDVPVEPILIEKVTIKEEQV